MTVHELEIEINAEGHQLAILSPLDESGETTGGFRIAGPKAWGGSRTVATIKIYEDDLIRYINDYAPNVKEAIKNG